MVYGGEIAYSNGPDAFIAGNPDWSLDPYLDLKGRVGYSFGKALVYGVLGYSQATYLEAGAEFEGDGVSYGVGVDYLVTDNIFLGVEYLTRQTSGSYPDESDNYFDLDVDTVSLRVGYKF